MSEYLHERTLKKISKTLLVLQKFSLQQNNIEKGLHCVYSLSKTALLRYYTIKHPFYTYFIPLNLKFTEFFLQKRSLNLSP